MLKWAMIGRVRRFGAIMTRYQPATPYSGSTIGDADLVLPILGRPDLTQLSPSPLAACLGSELNKSVVG